MLPGLIAAGGSILGGVLGGIFGGADRERAEEAQRQAEELINAVGAGPDLARAIMHNTFQQAGIMTPEVEQAINTEMDQKLELTERPEMRREQEMGLNSLKQLSRRGLGIEDQAAFNKLRAQVAGDTQSKQEQILQGMAQRGMSGSGNELAMQIAASQSGAQGEAEAADRIAAQASEARRSALKDVFSGAGQMRESDLNVDKYNTENERLRRQFLAENALGRQTRNVGTQNQAQMTNLQRQQQVSDANINQQNAELLRQRQAEQTMYENKLSLAQAHANAKTNQANQYMQKANNTQQSWGTMGTALGQGIEAIASKGKGKTPTKAFNGGRISGTAVLDHDHPANDKVDAKLSPGEIVVPRSFAKHPEAAKAFIEKLFTDEESEE